MNNSVETRFFIQRNIDGNWITVWPYIHNGREEICTSETAALVNLRARNQHVNRNERILKRVITITETEVTDNAS